MCYLFHKNTNRISLAGSSQGRDFVKTLAIECLIWAGLYANQFLLLFLGLFRLKNFHQVIIFFAGQIFGDHLLNIAQLLLRQAAFHGA